MCTYIVIQQQKRRYVNQALGECTSCQGDIPYQDRKAVPESNKKNDEWWVLLQVGILWSCDNDPCAREYGTSTYSFCETKADT